MKKSQIALKFCIIILLSACALLLLTFASPSFAGIDMESSVVQLPTDLGIDLSDRLDIFADTQRDLTIADVTAPSFQGFQRNKVKSYSRGVFSGNLWLRLAINPGESTHDELFLYIPRPLLEVRFFQKIGDHIVEQKGGRHFSTAEESYHSTYPSFRITPPETNATQYLYVMIRNDGVHSLALQILDHVGIWQEDRLQSWFGGFVTGFMIIMMLYNIFLFISTREADFLWYSLTVLFIHFGVIASGATNTVFYSGKIYLLPQIFIPLSKILGSICIVQFSRIFLRTQRDAKWVDRTLLGVIAFSLIMLLALTRFPASIINAVDNIGVFIGLVTMFSYSGVLFARGSKHARFYFIAWFPVLLVAMLQVILSMTGHGHLTTNMPTFLVIAAMVEVLLLSMALGDKINVLREEKEREEAQARLQKDQDARIHQEEIMRINAGLEVQVREKTADIRALLDNLPMAVMSIDENGAIGENVSAHTAQTLGKRPEPGDGIIGTVFAHSDLGADKKDSMMAAIGASVGQDDLGFVGSELFLVKRFAVNKGSEKKLFEANWSPITANDGAVNSLLLCIKDVTESEGLKQKAALAETQGRNMTEILMAGFAKVEPSLSFLRASFIDYSGKINRLMDSHQTSSAAEIAQHSHEFFRVLHTEKARTRSLKLAGLADHLHEMESCVSVLRQPQQLEIKKTEFNTAADRFERTLDGYCSALTSIKAALGEGKKLDAPNAPIPLNTVLQDILSMIPEIAASAEKPMPAIQLSAPLGLHISRDNAASLEGMMLHLLRNCMDHGIETPKAREQLGKDAHGLISIAIKYYESTHTLGIVLFDDGSGFNSELVARKAREKGLKLMPAEEIIFLAGFSSKESVTELSGRGVGLDAVRSNAQHLGGDAKAVLGSVKPNGNREIAFEIFMKTA